MPEVRLFARGDREQLTRLANAHIASVMPGWSVPAATLLSQLERQAGEYTVDPWVTDRSTLVAVDRDRVVAAVHLVRYSDDGRVGADYRDAGELAWLVFWPTSLDAGRAALAAATGQLEAWGVRSYLADGNLPATVTYGIPDAWPHVAQLLEEAGFKHEGQTEILLAGDLDHIPPAGDPPIAGMALQRVLGPLATSFNAVLEGGTVGVFEVDDDQTRGASNLSLAGWADECNHWVRDDLRRRGIGTWLVAHGAEWLRLGGVHRLVVYLIENDLLDDGLRYYHRFGLRPVSRTRRGWRRP